MRHLKMGAWHSPPVSKNDIGVGTLLVAAEKEWDYSFCQHSPFSLNMCCPYFSLGEFLHILIIIIIQFRFFFLMYSFTTYPVWKVKSNQNNTCSSYKHLLFLCFPCLLAFPMTYFQTFHQVLFHSNCLIVYTSYFLSPPFWLLHQYHEAVVDNITSFIFQKIIQHFTCCLYQSK